MKVCPICGCYVEDSKTAFCFNCEIKVITISEDRYIEDKLGNYDGQKRN